MVKAKLNIKKMNNEEFSMSAKQSTSNFAVRVKVKEEKKKQ